MFADMPEDVGTILVIVLIFLGFIFFIAPVLGVLLLGLGIWLGNIWVCIAGGLVGGMYILIRWKW